MNFLIFRLDEVGKKTFLLIYISLCDIRKVQLSPGFVISGTNCMAVIIHYRFWSVYRRESICFITDMISRKFVSDAYYSYILDS